MMTLATTLRQALLLLDLVFLTVLEAGSPRTGCQQISVWWVHFLVHRPPSSLCVLTWWEGAGSSLGLAHRDTNSIREGSELMTESPQTPSHWGLGFDR